MLSMPKSRQQVILRYANTLNPNQITGPTTAAYGQLGFALNDIYHFFRQNNTTPVAASATFMPMRSEWMDWYYQWRVNKVQIEVEFMNVGVGSGYFMIYCDPLNDQQVNLASNWSQLITIGETQKQGVIKPFNSVNGNTAMTRLRFNLSCGKFMGDLNNYRADFAWSGGTDADPLISPSKVINMYLLLMSSTGENFGTIYNVPFRMKVNFFLTMWGREGEVS